MTTHLFPRAGAGGRGLIALSMAVVRGTIDPRMHILPGRITSGLRGEGDLERVFRALGWSWPTVRKVIWSPYLAEGGGVEE